MNYAKKNIRHVVVDFNRNTEPELTAYIEASDNRSATIKKALREMMEREKSSNES